MEFCLATSASVLLHDFRHYCRLNPALASVLLFSCGLLTGLSPVPLWHSYALSALSFILVLSWRGAGSWRVWWLYPTGLVWGAITLAAPWQNFLSLLPRDECSASICGIVSSTPQDRQKNRCFVLALRAINTGDGWHDCRGKLQTTATSEDSDDLHYGDEVEATGAIMLPTLAAPRGHTSYGHYLLSRGIRRHFIAGTMTRRAEARGWRRLARCFRECQGPLGKRLCHGIDNDVHAAMYRAMILGNGELPRDVRDLFVRAGIVHIFCISGMHVALMTTAWLFILQVLFLPFRWRWPLLIPAVTLYVLLTGAAPSAARSMWMAMAMIAAVCSFRPQSLANALGLSAWILLAANPLDVYHSGFVFSFTIVAVLLHGWPVLSEATSIALEKDLWSIRTSWGHAISSRKHSLVGLVGGCGLAWLGSCGLTAFYNGHLSWGGLMANLALPPFTALLVYAAIPKIALASCCPPLSLWLGSALNQALGGMMVIARCCAGPGLFQPVVPWSLPVAAAYYAALALVIGARHWPLGQRICGLGLAAGIAASCLHRPPESPTLLYCQGDDGGAPALCLLSARGDGVVIIYPGSRASAYGLVDALCNEGIATVDWLLIPPNSRDRQGAMTIVKLMTIRTVGIIPPARQQDAASRTLTALRARGINSTILADDAGCFAVTWADGAQLQVHHPGLANEFAIHFAHPAAAFVLDLSHSRYGPTHLRWSDHERPGCCDLRPALRPLCHRFRVDGTGD